MRIIIKLFSGKRINWNKFSVIFYIMNLMNLITQKIGIQAGAELGQAQLKLSLDFTLIKIYYMKNLEINIAA